MGRIVSIHSYRGGTGKSNLTANIGYQLAARGHKVAILDTDLQSPGVHMVLQLAASRLTHTVSDYLFEKCEIRDAAYDMSNELPVRALGQLWLLPSSMQVDTIVRIAADGYDVGGADGLVGFKTRTAVGDWQAKAGQTPTCFPDADMVHNVR